LTGKVFQSILVENDFQLVGAIMHITEGVLTGPSVVITNVLGGAVIVWGVSAMNRFTKDQPSRKPLLGMAGAFIFFVSLIHLPAFGGLTCSHPCGTPLAGILLGPGVAAGLAACGLLLQALFFAHGGISTLGANTITLGLMGAGSGWLVFKICRKAGLSLAISAGLGGLVGDLLTYAMNIVILGAHFAYVAPHPQYDFWGYAKVLALAYLPVQGPIAIGEMLVTGYALDAIGRQRPEVLEALGVSGKKVILAALLLLGAGLAFAPQPLRAAEVAKPAQGQSQAPAAAQPAPAPTYSALDDLTDGMAAKAGTPTKDPLINLEKYHDIWSSLMMFAGLVVGFIIGRRWDMLFGKPVPKAPER
jgi:cobalt/nickel transport system permease protein